MATTRSVVITEFGPPPVMTLRSGDLPAPGAGEAQLRQTAIGFNFIDIYQRRGPIRSSGRPGSASRPRAWSRRSGRASRT